MFIITISTLYFRLEVESAPTSFTTKCVLDEELSDIGRGEEKDFVELCWTFQMKVALRKMNGGQGVIVAPPPTPPPLVHSALNPT